jgi:Flp pilus assembly protein TadB
MAQTGRRRKRKHRGTQSGSIDRRRRSRPRNRDEARAQARRSAGQRRDKAPTWRSAINRALLMSGILFALLAFISSQPIASSLLLSVTMLAIYVPAGYYLERFLYNRRRAAAQKARQEERG